MKILKLFLILVVIVALVSAYLIYKNPSYIKGLVKTDEQVQDVVQNTIPSPTTPTAPAISFTGTIKRFTRPATDIAYDYQIILSQPVIDTENASGTNQTVSSYILVPATDSLKQQIEFAVDKSVEVYGELKWGYAESKYLSVTQVNLK